MTRMLAQLAALTLLGLLGCLQPASQSCSFGGLCPDGLRCLSSGGVDSCISPTCGDGRLDPGESCDDGNNAAGDGCPPGCVATCGNGIVEADERCDDGNTIGGDGCSAACRSTEECGNGIVELAEACDDGGRSNHDGCSARCTSETASWQAFDVTPAPRANHAMAYDTAHGTTVLFGGRGALGVLGDTWTWDGAMWRRLDPGTVPPPRQDHAMTYDAARERVVLFGGNDREHSTWEWDGIRWSELQPATAPHSGLVGSAMAYDASRRRVVLFGGSLDGVDRDETWEWDGSDWRERATPTKPPPRASHTMAYDGVRRRIVLFGGIGAGGRLRDTWEYDGADWTVRSTALAPAARAHAAMASDAERILLFGGDGDTGILSDSWALDGTQWRALTTDAAPSACAGAAMIFDARHEQMILFGGERLRDPAVTAAGLSSETWSWQHAAWTPRNVPSALPEPRQLGGLAYDSLRGRTVLFGGALSSSGAHQAPELNDTWDWDGTVWTRIASPTAPTPRFGVAMAFDGHHVVLFGGRETVQGVSAPMNDTWVLEDARWQRRSPRSSPSPRFDIAMAYDPLRAKMVLFGGTSVTGGLSDTWEWDGTDWTQRFPRHTPPARFFPALAFDPVQGRVLMFGGSSVVDHALVRRDDTWEWDGDDWIEQTTSRAPGPGPGHAIAQDPVRHTILVFDGSQPTTEHDSETWEWDGDDWRSRPTIAPRQQDGVAMAYDAARGRMVMFGGSSSATGGLVVSEWDGNAWHDVEPIRPLPAPRARPAVIYDAERSGLVVFGGGVGGNLNVPAPVALNDMWTWSAGAWREQPVATRPPPVDYSMAFDSFRRRAVVVPASGEAATWEWDGARWLRHAPGIAPTPRARPAMVYDAARHQTLLLGGTQVDHRGPSAEHWAWDGETWTQLVPGPPFALSGAAAAYDARRERVVLFGGGTPGFTNDPLWEWTGKQWIQRPATGPWPPGRTGHTLVYNPARQRVVLFGGRTELGTVLNDLWEWDGSSWQSIRPSGRLPTPRTDHAMVYDEARRALVLFGGITGWQELQDLWLLRYDDPAVPDEVSP